MISRLINANMGERSNPPIGGMSLLNGASIGSVKSFRNLKGCFHQSILGNQDNNILKIRISSTSPNNC